MTTTYSKLPHWEKYETDLSFRRWIDSGEQAPDYTLAALLSGMPPGVPTYLP